MIKEGNAGLGMQLRLGAGPLINAAAAAKLCAGLAENDRHCETTVFDGQRLSMRGGSEKGQEKTQDRVQEKNADKNQDAVPQAETAPALAPAAKPEKRRRSYSSKRSSKREEPAPAPAPQPPAAPAKPETASTGSALSSFFRR
ncbi:putative membrane protein [Bradyrhizobium japonicum]